MLGQNNRVRVSTVAPCCNEAEESREFRHRASAAAAAVLGAEQEGRAMRSSSWTTAPATGRGAWFRSWPGPPAAWSASG